MKLSLCMIVRNEADNLEACLTSVRDVVDEMVVVDTGSEDETMAIAQQMGAKVHQMTWQDDFSAARNQALELATGDWILVMDADERLHPESATKLRARIASTKAEALRVMVRDHFALTKTKDYLTNVATRLFRNRPQYRYQRRIHEQIEAAIIGAGLGEPLELSDLIIEHYGYTKHAVETKSKRERNLALLEEDAKTIGDPFAFYNLGVEYLRQERFQDALAAFAEAEKTLDPQLGFCAELMDRKAICLMIMERYDEALKVLGDGLRYYPDFPDLSYQMGEIYLKQHRYHEAIEAFLECRRIGDQTSGYYSLHGIGSYRAAYAIGLVYHELRDFTQALSWYRQSLSENPGHVEAVERIAELLKETLNEPARVEEELARYFDFTRPGARAAFLRLLFKIELYPSVLAHIEELLAEDPKHQRWLHYGAISALHCQAWDKAIGWAELMIDQGSAVLDALLLILVSHWGSGDLAAAQETVSRMGRLMREQEMLYAVCQQMQWYMEGRSGFSLRVEMDDAEQRKAYRVAVLTVLRLVLSSGERQVLGKVIRIMEPLTDELSVWLDLGLLYFKHGLYDLAEAELTDCDQRGAYSADSLLALGKLALWANDLEQAVQYLNRSLAIEPHQIEGRQLLAIGYRRLAEQVLLDGIQRHPDALLLIKELEKLKKGG